MKNQPSHVVSFQKDISINKETNTTLSTSSQKDLDIERSSYPGAKNMGKGGEPITLYVRKKKVNKTQVAVGAHTQHIPETTSLENVLSSSSTPIDASQANAEMQPQNLSIQLSPPHSISQISLDVFMIDNMVN